MDNKKNLTEVKLTKEIREVTFDGSNPAPLGMPQKALKLVLKPTFGAILSGAGFFPSTVGMEKYGISFQMIQFVLFYPRSLEVT